MNFMLRKIAQKNDSPDSPKLTQGFIMKSALKPALENLDKALGQLETAVEKRFQVVKKQKEEPQLDLTARNERDVNRKIAAKLDQTINRLEMLLTEE
jgi:hypothetical protein